MGLKFFIFSFDGVQFEHIRETLNFFRRERELLQRLVFSGEGANSLDERGICRFDNFPQFLGNVILVIQVNGEDVSPFSRAECQAKSKKPALHRRQVSTHEFPQFDSMRHRYERRCRKADTARLGQREQIRKRGRSLSDCEVIDSHLLQHAAPNHLGD